MPSSAPRSGCALVSGVAFIVLGVLLLLQNLSDLALVELLGPAFSILADYWPLALIAWGAYKIYQRLTNPDARVSALEVLVLVLVVGAGLAIAATRSAVDRLARSELGDELAAVLGPEFAGPMHRFEDETSFELSPGAALSVVNELGGIRAVGWDGSGARVVLDKRVHRRSEDEARRVAEDIRFEIRDAGAAVVGPDTGARVDVELHLPRGTRLAARSPRGGISVRELDGSVELDTREGDVTAEQIGGSIAARTSHGDVRIDRVAGGVDAQSRHGSIVARNLGAELRAETSRGSVSAEDVSGPAVLASRYGTVHAERMRDDLEIRARHARVGIEDVSGSVQVDASDAPVFVRGVEESLRVEARNARLEVRDVGGDVTIDNRLQPVRVTNVGGALSVRTSNGGVFVEGAAGPVTVEATNEDVRILDFRSGLRVRSTHGSLEAGTTLLAGDVLLETRYGDVALTLPEAASFALTATSRNGDLLSDSGGLAVEASRENEARVWTATSGAGAQVVILSTVHGDIRLGTTEP